MGGGCRACVVEPLAEVLRRTELVPRPPSAQPLAHRPQLVGSLRRHCAMGGFRACDHDRAASGGRRDAMSYGIPCRVGYRAAWDTIQGAIPCRWGYCAVRKFDARCDTIGSSSGTARSLRIRAGAPDQSSTCSSGGASNLKQTKPSPTHKARPYPLTTARTDPIPNGKPLEAKRRRARRQSRACAARRVRAHGA
jgi:hypothetical protein